ncbi:TPA: hypothetical protein OQ574_001354 [Salmonella enterica]|nr:hypothetical protein [Salmonella enterica]
MKTHTITLTGHHNMMYGYHNAVLDLAVIVQTGHLNLATTCRGAHNVDAAYVEPAQPCDCVG